MQQRDQEIPDEPKAPEERQQSFDFAAPEAKSPEESHHPKPKRKGEVLTKEERQEVLRLKEIGLGTRKIARQLRRSRTTIQKFLKEEAALPEAHGPIPDPNPPSKLDPFRPLIKEKVALGLTAARILREIREEGYEGGLSILTECVRSLRAPLAPRKRVKRRFETEPGQELQVDWSTYRMQIGGRQRVVQMLAMVLGHSRMASLVFFDSQRLSRLLEGLERGFAFFGGVTQRVVFDNMATVVLGRVGRDSKPIYNPDFLPFAKHYGFEPFLCRVADPDRKGIVEAFIGFAERDLVRGTEAESMAHLNQLAQRWLSEVANQRTHGTTGEVPAEAFAREKDFLIQLPDSRYSGACDLEYRQVAQDSTVSVGGVLYTVPARLACRQVRVRLYAERFEVLDRDGSVAFSRAYLSPQDRRRLVIDPSHYEGLPKSKEQRGGKTRALEESFLVRWPQLEDFLAGLKSHMKRLVHVDLKRLLRLADDYGDAALADAMTKAHAVGRHTGNSVQRILEQDALLLQKDPVLPQGAEARAQLLLDEVEEDSLEGFGHLDSDLSEEEVA